MIVWVITLHFIVNCLNFFTWKGCYHLPSFLANSIFSSILFLKMMGGHLGSMGLYCMAFLFLPVARGSVLLRFINIPFEHATRYHVWLGHLTMVLFTLHGLLYVVGWAMEGNLLHKVSPHASLFSFFSACSFLLKYMLSHLHVHLLTSWIHLLVGEVTYEQSLPILSGNLCAYVYVCLWLKG